MELAQTRTPVGAFEDHRWLDGHAGLTRKLPITIDGSLFTDTTNFPDGVIPAGTVLAKVTTGGLYGPYDDTAVDGRAVAVGFLLSTSLVGSLRAGLGAGKDSTVIITGGAIGIITNKLVATTGHPGFLDAAGKTDLANFQFRTV